VYRHFAYTGIEMMAKVVVLFYLFNIEDPYRAISNQSRRTSSSCDIPMTEAKYKISLKVTQVPMMALKYVLRF
jgi:hypothetical protein